MLSILWLLALTSSVHVAINEAVYMHPTNPNFNALTKAAAGVHTEADIKQNMTITQAIALLEKNQETSPALLDFVKSELHQEQAESMLQSDKSGSLRKETAGRRRRTRGYSGVDSAKKKLNEMIHETAVKLDLELIRCSTYERSQLAYIEKLRQDIATFQAESAAAASEILRAQAQISIFSKKLPIAKAELLELLKRCKLEKLELERQLAIIKADINVMEKVMAMTDCKSATMLLLHCTDTVTGREYTEYNPTLVQEMTHLQNAESQSLMKDIMYPTDAESEEGIPMLALAQLSDERRATTQIPTTPTPPNATLSPPTNKQRAKCSISGSPMCPKLRERFMDIATGIEDKRKELEAALRELEKKCKDGKQRLEAQISLFEHTLRTEEAALAHATTLKTNADEQTRLTQIELEKALKGYNEMMAQCRLNVDTYRTEKCGLEKIRTELYKMKGQDVFLQDCEVTDWSALECSQSCGGGTQSLSRTIRISPNGGAACPPLQATQSCNEDPCPVDCITEDWTAWSACSAKCGGGVRSKSREVTRPPEHNGAPCGETSRTESCNIQACDVNCVLSDWTVWGACSKECDGGTLTRVKEVFTPAIGQGTCPAEHSDARIQHKPCNQHPCMNATTMVMSCVAKIDVILLLDGSGSLGADGWAATLAAGATLARAMTGDVNLAVLLFSGPTSYPSLWKCTGQQPGQPDMVNDCGIQWVSHFSNDTASVATAIEGLSYPQKTTLTSLAISTAETELSTGRADAASVVVVITDGKPLSEGSTTLASMSIRKKARLLWVPVGRWVPLKDMRKWASYPWQENVVHADSFAQLTSPQILNHVIADMCPDILTEVGRPSSPIL